MDDPEEREELLAESETRFFFRRSPAGVTFERGANGKVGKAILHLFWSDQVAEKVE